MNNHPMRRVQLIAPFGVGSLHTGPDGVATITAGLDHWFRRSDGSRVDIDIDEYQIDEWRLKRILGVGQLRLPPDYREPFGFGQTDQKNLRLTVPLVRFPRWHFCSRSNCRALLERPPTAIGSQWCPKCELRGTKSKLTQVRFIALCSAGHVQDFPWREWVHRSPNPSCGGNLKLISTGGASLTSLKVECDCGVAARSLYQITEASSAESIEKSYITSNLAPDSEYRCRGIRPWLGDFNGEGCDRALRGSLRSAINVYYAHVESLIYIPKSDTPIDPIVDSLLREPPLSTWIKTVRDIGHDPTVEKIRNSDYGDLLAGFDDEAVETGLRSISEEIDTTQTVTDENVPSTAAVQEAIRRPEFERIRQQQNHEKLVVRTQDPSLYSDKLSCLISRVNLVDVLRETRALYGFSRVMPAPLTYREHRDRMWLAQPKVYNHNWLPAYEVNGEGIYIELNSERLAEWEPSYEQSRLAIMQRNSDAAQARRGLNSEALLARYILIHTFAHLLINRLVFDCGYSSASLRERLYVAAGDQPMAGVLIYTAAGDSEGTMGGLVRMGQPGMLDPVVSAALSAAVWCSADPVCMELGEHGQGPENCNLAACHSCCLLPETSCETFNKHLDRAAVIGTHADPSIGFFAGVLT